MYKTPYSLYYTYLLLLTDATEVILTESHSNATYRIKLLSKPFSNLLEHPPKIHTHKRKIYMPIEIYTSTKCAAE